MNTKEARAEFILTLEDACIESCDHDSKDGWEHNITIAADAYALAVLDAALASAPLGAVYVRGWKESRRIAIRREIEEAT